MIARSPRTTILVMSCLAGCQCASENLVDLDSDVSTSASGESLTASSTSGDGSSTGEPFDASRWIGRYHFEHVFLPFGERGDPHGDYSLINFEILADSRATIFYDSCGFEEPVTRTYEWHPDEKEGWIELGPGPGEPWLRFLGPDPVGTIRIELIEPCRELIFEIDGIAPGFTIVRPGESCWVDRCTCCATGGTLMQVDYCEGEEPPPCP